jgi:hypothetical protein
MNIAKVIQRRIRRSTGGAQVDGDVNAAVAANVGEPGQVTRVSSTQHASAGSGSERTEPDGPKPA